MAECKMSLTEREAWRDDCNGCGSVLRAQGECWRVQYSTGDAKRQSVVVTAATGTATGAGILADDVAVVAVMILLLLLLLLLVLLVLVVVAVASVGRVAIAVFVTGFVGDVVVVECSCDASHCKLKSLSVDLELEGT